MERGAGENQESHLDPLIKNLFPVQCSKSSRTQKSYQESYHPFRDSWDAQGLPTARRFFSEHLEILLTSAALNSLTQTFKDSLPCHSLMTKILWRILGKILGRILGWKKESKKERNEGRRQARKRNITKQTHQCWKPKYQQINQEILGN